MYTSALRLLALRGWRTLCVRRRRPLGACGNHYLVIWEKTSLNTYVRWDINIHILLKFQPSTT